MLRPLRRMGIICAGVLIWLAAVPAQAACPQDQKFYCIDGFDNINGMVWSGRWLIALGQHEKNDGPRQYSLVRIGKDLDTGSLASVVIPLPWDQLSAYSLPETTVLKPRLRHLLVDGESIFVAGEIEFSEENGPGWSVGWAIRFDKNAQPLWNRLYSRPSLMGDNQNSRPYVRFESAHFHRNTNSLIVVGRAQQGADPKGTCEFQSNSLVARLDLNGDVVVADDLAIDDFFARQDRAQPTQLPARRHAFYDISATDNPGEYVLTGFRSAPKTSGSGPTSGCQDNVFWSVVHIPGETPIKDGEAQSRFAAIVTQPQTIGSATHHDLTYSTQHVGLGRYLFAGRGHNTATGTQGAQVYLVNAKSAGISDLKNDHHPFGTDGRSRYYAVHEIAGEGRYVVAGSAAHDSPQPNAIWSMYATRGDTLEQVRAPRLVDGLEHAHIRHLASVDNGGVFAAGSAKFDNKNHAWIAPLFDPQSNARQLVSKIQQPDQSLRRLNTLNQKDGYFELTGGDIAQAGRYFGARLGAGAQLEFIMTLEEPTIVDIAFVAQTGDADLILMDDKYKVVAFSDFQGNTNEMLEARLEPGTYYLSIPALTNIPAYELRVSTGGKTDEVMQQVQALREIDRGRLLAALEGAGYSLSAAPDTKMFGHEAVLALRAANLSAQSGTGSAETLRAAIEEAFGE